MGLGMKSLTGSRRVIEILNRLGHSICYHTAETTETELASNISKKDKLIPDMLLQKPDLSTGLAWDNHDELTDTLSGRDTFHDTVGVCYQNKILNPVSLEEHVCHEKELSSEKPTKRRRKYEAPEQIIVPYNCRPFLSKFNYDNYTVDLPTSILKKAKQFNLIWIISCHETKVMPTWHGWNSLVCNDDLPRQVIGYMENIELPPTRLDVVRETLIRSQKVAHECGDKYAIVHCDLAIAKSALQIQAQESPKFDNIFICFGTFHIFMAYFGSLGYILESSGAAKLLCSADVLASGSVRGFLAGKHFNRCKRLHPLFSAAIQILHFKHFVELHGAMTEECSSLLKHFACNPTPESIDRLLNSDAINTLLVRYEKFCECTRHGYQGATGMFWIIYVDLVHLYLHMDRACRTNKIDLYIYALGQMCPIFFGTHRPNYARWMTRYHLNLINMEHTHEGICSMLEGVALSIRRTSNTFPRSPVDLTLEQTINKDAASRQGGIAAFTNNVSARKRWTVTRSIRGSIVSVLLDKAGLTISEETSQELKPSRISNDNSDLVNIMKQIENALNPFSLADDQLYCLTTGRAASHEVNNNLLQIAENGAQWYHEFLNDCKDSPGRFEKPIKCRKIKNFANDAVKIKLTGRDQRIKETRCTRDLFG